MLLGNKFREITLSWILLVPVLLGYIHTNDPILKYMCSPEFGEKFWRDLLECGAVLNPQTQLAMNTCIPVSNFEQAETTRIFICSHPGHWIQMMECIHDHLIQMQDDSNPHLELSPGKLYRTCVRVLVSEAALSSTSKSHLLEGNRTGIHGHFNFLKTHSSQ